MKEPEKPAEAAEEEGAEAVATGVEGSTPTTEDDKKEGDKKDKKESEEKTPTEKK